MKIRILLLTLLITHYMVSIAQMPTPIYRFTFDSSLTETFNSINLNVFGGGTITYGTDRFGDNHKAMNISSNYLSATLANLPVGNTARTVVFWAKYNNLATHYLFSYGAAAASQAYGLTQEAGSISNYAWQNDMIANGASITLNQWYHYVVTYDGTTAKLYRNGTLLISAAKNWSTNASGKVFNIGTSLGQFFGLNGSLDDIRIYNTALSDANVAALYAEQQTLSSISATAITNNSVTINYTLNANGYNTSTLIKYGTSYNSLTLQQAGTGASSLSNVTATVGLTGLQPYTTYYYQVEATNSLGVIKSAVYSFTTTGNMAALQNGLVAYYGFENNFNAQTSLYNCSAASGLSGVSFSPSGKYGACANFSSRQGTLYNNNVATAIGTDAFSIVCWVQKTVDYLDYSSVFELSSSAFFRYNNFVAGAGWAQEWGMAVSSALYKTQAASALPLGAWQHIAMVFEKNGANTSYLRLYYEGVNVVTINLGNNINFYQFNNVFTIGGGTNNNGTFNASKCFSGMIDEMYVYNRALNVNEINAIKTNAAGILPSTLASFKGTFINQTAKLQWSTLAEVNANYIEVEYSKDANNFTAIGRLQANGKASTYSYQYATPILPVHYFRLKMIDKDGTYTYSKVIKLIANYKAGFQLMQNYPNPVTEQTNIGYTLPEDAHVQLQLFSQSGSLIATLVQQTQGAGTYQFSLQKHRYHLNAGHYYYTISVIGDQQQVLFKDTKTMLIQ